MPKTSHLWRAAIVESDRLDVVREKKNAHSNSVYIWKNTDILILMKQNDTPTLGLTTVDRPREDETFRRVSRLNMNYPYKLYSWRVKAMTVVAKQRHCTKDIDWRGHWQYSDTVISHKWPNLHKKKKNLRGPPSRKKKKNQHPPSTWFHISIWCNLHNSGLLASYMQAGVIFQDVGRRIELIKPFDLGCYSDFRSILEPIMGHRGAYYDAQQRWPM